MSASARGCSGPPRSGRSPTGSGSGPPSDSARTSSSTPARSGASSGWPACGPTTSCSRSARASARSRSGCSGPRSRVVAVEVDPRARRRSCRRPSPTGRLPWPAGSRWSPPTRSASRDPLSSQRADGAGGEPALQRGRPRRAAPARGAAVDRPRAGHGPGRGRRPDVRAAGQQDLRRARRSSWPGTGQRPAGRERYPGPCSGPCRTWTRRWSPLPAGPTAQVRPRPRPAGS